MRQHFNFTKRTEFLVTNTDAAIPKRLTAGTIIDLTRPDASAAKVVVTTSNEHGLTAGCSIVFVDDGDEFVGTHGVTSVNSSTEFVLMIPPETNPGAVSLAYYGLIPFRHAVLLGCKDYRTANVGNVYIGSQSTNDKQPYIVEPYSGGGIGEAYLRSGEIGDAPVFEDLSDYYLDVANANDGLVIRYI